MSSGSQAKNLGPIRLGGSEGGVGFLVGDEAAGELDQGEVVLAFLRPADEDRAVAVQPGVSGRDDPASGSPAGLMEPALDLFTAGAGGKGCAA